MINSLKIRTASMHGILGVVFGLVAIMVAFSPSVMSAAISQGYRADGPLEAGTLVSIQPSTNAVAAADITNSDGLLGVVVQDNSATLAINSKGDSLQVATNGSAQVFVTDIEGPIKRGDQIAPSPIKGVGMKATQNGKVLGVVQGDFDGSKSLKTTTLTTKNGQRVEAHIGTVPVAVQVTYYTVENKSVVPSFLQQFANSVAGKDVSLARLVIIGVILLAAMMLVTILLFSAVRGAIVSLGRNPLAKSSIYRGMSQVLAVSVVILGIALTSVYVILSR